MHSPLFESFAIVSENDVFLWIHTDKVVPGLLVHLTPPDCETNRYFYIHRVEKRENLKKIFPSKFFS